MKTLGGTVQKIKDIKALIVKREAALAELKAELGRHEANRKAQEAKGRLSPVARAKGPVKKWIAGITKPAKPAKAAKAKGAGKGSAATAVKEAVKAAAA